MADKIRNNEGFQYALDDIVLDRYSIMACELNNDGAEAQLKWLEEVCGEDIEHIFEVISTESEVTVRDEDEQGN